MTTAAVLATILLAVIAVFQLALAAGAPIGRAAWGGRHPGVLPTRLRVASGVAGVIVYPALALLVLGTAGVIDADRIPGTGPVAAWALTAFFALGTLANAASPSTPERVWAPVSLALAVCCGVIAAGA